MVWRLIVVVSSVLHSDTSAAFYASNYCLAQLFAGLGTGTGIGSANADRGRCEWIVRSGR